ncbi:NlpC/P60 family protein [Streptomyces sp. NPDC127068]|uniref:C40 family peptidase n=1 Tax=Streptomyces sp. NPDC127068 TaxID=3347127 RepID=UPI00364D1448
MASHRRPKQPSRARVTVLTVTAAAAVALTAQSAQAAPSEKPTKDEVKSKVDKLYEEAAQATEKYNGAKEKQEKLEGEIGTLQDKVARGQDEVNELRSDLGSLASAQYRSGGIDPSLQLLLSADPDSYLDKASTLDQLSGQQVEALRTIQEKQRSLSQQRQEAGDKLKDLADTRTELGDKKSEVQAKLNEAQKLLNSLTAAEKKALEEAEQRASRNSERTALKAQQDEAKKDSGKSSSSGKSGSTATNTDTGTPGSGKPTSGRTASAYAAAQSKLGKPYIYGTNGPNSFDCSGLTSWAYAQANQTIPRTSQAQTQIGTRINSQSDLQVGDLVFFYSDLHHVGFYAGNGQVLHAPRSGTVVRYEPMSNMPYMFGVRV